MKQEGFKVYKYTKRERDQYPAILTKHSWSIKDFCCGTQRVAPSRKDSVILSARAANRSAGFS